jgi:hypothetical protein
MNLQLANSRVSSENVRFQPYDNQNLASDEAGRAGQRLVVLVSDNRAI